MGLNYKQKLDAEKQMMLEVGTKQGFQRACDCIAIALNSPECMGKGVMSGERIHRIFEYAIALDDEYYAAFAPRDPECDYCRAKLDARQKLIFKDRFVPFEDRYKYLRQPK